MPLFGLKLGSFGEGFVTGAARAVDREIQADIAKTDENVSRLAQLRMERASRTFEENKKTEKQKRAEIEKMVAEVGSADGVQYLIDNFSYDEALKMSATLNAQKQTLGIDPLHEIGLAERNGASVTVDQLVKYHTPIVELPPVSDLEGTVAVGFGKMFGRDAVAEVENLTNAEMAARGFVPQSGEEVVETLPPTLAGKLRPYMLGRLADPKKESERLHMVSSNLLARGDKEAAAAAKSEATKMTVIARLNDKATKKTDKFTPSDVRATQGIISTQLAGHMGVKGNLSDDGRIIVDLNTEEAKKDEYTKRLGYLSNVVTAYMKSMGNTTTAYNDALEMVGNAIADNKMLVLQMPVDEDGIPRLVMTDTRLYNPKGSKRVVGDGTDTDAAVAAQQGMDTDVLSTGTGGGQPSKQQNIQALVGEYPNASPKRQKQILDDLKNMGAATEAMKLKSGS